MPGLGIIFHSGSYDRVHHGLSLALAAGAIGGPVKLFFTYWALEWLKKNNPSSFAPWLSPGASKGPGPAKLLLSEADPPAPRLDSEALERGALIARNIKGGHLRAVSELLSDGKTLGIKVYVCTNSMGILNIARDELVGEVDKSMGITGFMMEVAGYQLLFI